EWVRGVDEDRTVAAAGRDHGVVISTQYGRDVVDAVQPLAYDIEHRRFRIDRVDMAGGADRAREEWREVAGAAAHLSDHLPARETQRAHERGWLLPLRALRIELTLERGLQLVGRHFFGAHLISRTREPAQCVSVGGTSPSDAPRSWRARRCLAPPPSAGLASKRPVQE